MAKQPVPATAKFPLPHRRFSDAFRRDAVQMLLDGHTAVSVAERLGLSGPNLLYRWKAQQLHPSGPLASSLDDRVREFEAELVRVTRERDIRKKALAIFGRHE